MRAVVCRLGMIAALLGLVTASAGQARADVGINLIVNGGFEDPGTNSGQLALYTGGQTIGVNGWMVTGNDVLVLNNTYAEQNITFNSHGGSNALDITGAGNTGPNDGVFQSIATTVGQEYLVQFYVGRGDDTGSTNPRYRTPSSIGLTITGTGATALISDVYTNSNVTPNQVNYQLFSTEFVANSSSTRIAFTNATPTIPNGGNNYAGLDAVSVTAVPEPSPLVLAGLTGLAGFGFVWCRGRRATAPIA